jgi:hypothetical protein
MNEERVKQVWLMAATDAAPLGPRAVQDQLEKAHYDNVRVASVVVVPLQDHAYKVRIGYHYNATPELRYVELAVRNPNIECGTWEGNLNWIKQRQAALAPPCRGLPHNCDEFMTRTITEKVKRDTGYTGLGMGDLWVHSCATLDEAKAVGCCGPAANEGMVAFGYLTRAGEIAFGKYLEVHQTATDGEPTYIRGDHGGCVQSGHREPGAVEAGPAGGSQG